MNSVYKAETPKFYLIMIRGNSLKWPSGTAVGMFRLLPFCIVSVLTMADNEELAHEKHTGM